MGVDLVAIWPHESWPHGNWPDGNWPRDTESVLICWSCHLKLFLIHWSSPTWSTGSVVFQLVVGTTALFRLSPLQYSHSADQWQHSNTTSVLFQTPWEGKIPLPPPVYPLDSYQNKWFLQDQISRKKKMLLGTWDIEKLQWRLLPRQIPL